jgi:hypothetical protein
MDILVLVCALGVAAPDCQPETSIDNFHAPGSQADFAGCLREGMLYAATSGLVTEGTYPKIVCVARPKVLTADRRPTSVASRRPAAGRQ